MKKELDKEFEAELIKIMEKYYSRRLSELIKHGVKVKTKKYWN
jgi:hypothetical protein